MSLIDRFGEYARAFERFFEGEGPQVLEPFFTENAVYETAADPPLGGRHEGRAAVFEHMAQSLEGFDKRFESRELELLEAPALSGDEVSIRWRATYRVADAPPLVLEGEESAFFEGDRIRRLEDRYAPDAAKGVIAWMEEHGAKLAAA